MVLDCLDISGIICGTWCDLYKIYLIVWYEAASYLQFSSSNIIVSQVVYSNIVFNHNPGYIFQLQLSCRQHSPKMGYFLSLTWGVDIHMMSNQIIAFFLSYLLTYFLSFLLSYLLNYFLSYFLSYFLTSLLTYLLPYLLTY